MTNGEGLLKRYGVGLVVIAGHLFLAALLTLHDGVEVDRSKATELILVLVPVTPAVKLGPGKAAAFSRGTAKARRRDDTQRHSAGDPEPADYPASLPTPIDWDHEREREAAVAASPPEKRRDCDEVHTPGSIRPLCKRASHFDWHPNPRPVEIDGLIPYVHLGKRCVLGLGFFGCGIGKLPDPNGKMFDYMKDPDRPRSSVPDLPK